VARPSRQLIVDPAVTELCAGCMADAAMHGGTPDVETVVEVVHGMMLEHAHVGAAVKHTHRAVAAARTDAEVLTVGVLA
jgi:hypothetical protein